MDSFQATHEVFVGDFYDRHRSRGGAALQAFPSSTGHEQCTQVPNWISMKTGPEREFGVTES
jgi:hypothetical protein